MLRKSLWVLPLALLLGLVLAAPSAQACCVYNNTGGNVKFAWHLAQDWHVGPHAKQCENGRGGTMDIVWVLKMAKDVKICVDIPVANHGWVTVDQSENTFTVKSFNQDGTVKVTCTRTIDSAILKK